VDSFEGALCLAGQTSNIQLYLPPGKSEKKLCPDLHPWQVKKSSKLIFCAVYYLTVLLYTKATIHQVSASVGG